MKYVWGMLLLVVLGACTTNGHSTQDTITIGVSVPLSGNAGYFGQETRRGIELALSELPAEERNRIALDWQDDQCAGQPAIQAAQHFGSKGIKYSIGPLCNAASGPSESAFDQYGIQVVHLGMTNKAIENMADNHVAYLPRITDVMRTLAEHVYETGHRTVGILYLKDAFGQENADTFEEHFVSLGGEVVGKEAFTQAEREVKTQLVKIQVKEPDAVLLAAYGPALTTILQDMKDLEMEQARYGINAFETRPVLGEELAEGTVYPQPESRTETPEKKAFQQHYRETYDGLPGVYSANAYDSFNILWDAIKTCGQDNTACVQEKLNTIERWDGANGPLSATDGIGAFETHKLKTVRDGAFVALEV